MSSTIVGASIYTGPWVDWSRGVILGSTITLSNRWGAVLTAFLAFFVTVVGACLWRTFSFILHQISASADAKDGMHHQHQVIFRNTSSPAEATRAFFENAFFWRKNGQRVWLRSLPLALFALLFMLGFAAASLLTSLVTKAAGSQRLVVSGSCGFFGYDPSASLEIRTKAQVSRDLNETILAATYTRTCYDGGHRLNKLQCGTFVKPELAFKTDDKADCPFDSSMCLGGNVFKLDTGLLDSHYDLGINAPVSGRVEFRKVTTCAPIVQDGYVNVINSTSDYLGQVGDTIRMYQYGVIQGMTDNDTTYMYNQHAIMDGFGYEFNAVQASPELKVWQPIKEIERNDSDITLMFLAPNAIKYYTPNNDPFYSANYKVDGSVYGGVTEDYYLTDEWVKVMGCTDQFQYCNTQGDKKCTPLGSYYQAYDALNQTGLNDVQYMVAERIALNTRAMSVYHSISGRGAAALRANELVADRVQLAINDNQWHNEVTSWFSISLAKLQRGIMEYASGTNDLPAGTYVQKPTGPISKAMCYSQKTSMTTNTVSFSVLGVALTLAIGVLIMFIYLIQEPVVGMLQKRYKWGDYRRLRWVMDDKMQLQRMAFEEAGMGEWKNLSSNVPVTEKGQVFGSLEHVDPEQPRLGTKWTRNESGMKTTTSSQSSSRRGSIIQMTSLAATPGQIAPMSPYDATKINYNAYSKPVYQAVPPPPPGPAPQGQPTRFTEGA